MTELDMVIKAAERASMQLYKRANEANKDPMVRFGEVNAGLALVVLRDELERVRAEEMP